MKRQRAFFQLSIVIMLILQACNLPDAKPTQQAELDPLIAAQLTITAMAPTQPAQVVASNTVQPTLITLPTLTSTPQVTAAPAVTSTPTFAYVTLSQATNCRTGPGVNYDLLGTFQPGQTIEVVGKHPTGEYWYVRNPNNPNSYCWLWGAYAIGGNLGSVPAFTPPPSPTSATKGDFTAEYVNSGNCSGWWSRINLTNRGTVAFKSISISIKDMVTSETHSSSGDGFQDVNACVLSSKAPVLGPGDAYIVVSPSLSADPSGHKVSVTITLCPNTGQGGTCSSQTVEFKP
jgi:hypothetical protein